MKQTTRSYTATITLLLIVLGVGAVITGIALSGQGNEDGDLKDENITSFEECVAAGNLVMESYPEQCSANGETFTRDVGNVVEKMDMIRVHKPGVGEEVNHTFTAKGSARGPWFFEATFPVVVLDESENEIGQGFAQAQGEWMTEEFVPFTAEITIDKDYTGEATIVFEKQNASGLPENADSLYFPITVVAGQEPAPHPVSQGECYVGGCSGQVCSDDPAGVVTTCEWRPEYACYKDATCERQSNGECGWTDTAELRACLESA